ncbi:DUF6503 family protein [Flagellimonas profundi]|jgi:hypothetical protein|uniref:Deoxyribose-phosphate aldolase n=1 Tax=Flagellimonas profundi TaxID=2915620 RepID=A0ABS3FCB7_9FLAO|nr:DUF6503 family protein [Allomuricauda profundi]MBO0340673.1 deoxyribose-phosphate aldolase [Allomuricauda profundi]
MSYKFYSLLILTILFVFTFNWSIGQVDILDNAIKASGLEKLKNAEASFDFREYHYNYKRDKGRFEYIRSWKKTDGTKIRDVYTNNGLERYVADTLVELTGKRRKAYTNSVNSVVYFAFLPLWLKDPAVMLHSMGTTVIKGKEYYKIRVTFKEEGGGDDFEDVFLYWFDVDDYSMDYLAYKYKTGKGGMRFREAYNVRKANGVTIQDYRNFKPKIRDSFSFNHIEKAFAQGHLEILSEIELKNVKIGFLNK